MRYRAVLYILPFLVFLTALGSIGVREAEVPPPITIAVGVPLSGEWSGHGEEIVNAVELAVQEINEDGGLLGSELTVVFWDTVADPHVASALSRRWGEDPTIVAQVGGFASAPTLAAQRLYDATGVVQISPAVGHPAYAAGSPWSFSMIGLLEGEGRANARFAFSRLGVRRAAVLYEQGEWGQRQAREFAEEFAALGGRVVSRHYLLPGEAGYDRFVRRLQDESPELVYLATKDDQGRAVCRELTFLPGNSPIVLAPSKLHSPSFIETAGEETEGVYISSFFAPEAEATPAHSFSHRFGAYHGSEPGRLAALSYDAVHLTAEAIRRAGSRERESVRDALLNIEEFSGVTGTISFDGDGNALRDYAHLRIEGGQFVSQ